MNGEAAIDRAAPADLDAILALLRRSKLPVDGLAAHLATTLAARIGGRIVGSAALEMYDDGALLRSVAVDPDVRGRGIGRLLTNAAFRLARDRRVPAVYLLTTTAEEYFPRYGFERIERGSVPPGVRTSVEFASACPSTAIVMRSILETESTAQPERPGGSRNR